MKGGWRGLWEVREGTVTKRQYSVTVKSLGFGARLYRFKSQLHSYRLCDLVVLAVCF